MADSYIILTNAEGKDIRLKLKDLGLGDSTFGLAVTTLDSTGNQVTIGPAPLANYYFLGSAAGQTVKGFYVTAAGLRTGNSFSLSLNAASGAALPLPSIPSDAVGAIVRFSGATYVDLAASSTSDFTTNYVNYPQYSAANGNVFIGRVNA